MDLPTIENDLLYELGIEDKLCCPSCHYDMEESSDAGCWVELPDGREAQVCCRHIKPIQEALERL